MRSIDEIREIKKSYVESGSLYSKVRAEQSTDQSYYDDTFAVPEIHPPHVVYRSGLGVRIIDAPAEQIVTSNPQVFVEAIKGTKDSALKISKVFNNSWIDTLRRQNPMPFRESVKNPLLLGETFVRITPNPYWTLASPEKKGLPIIFQVPDPRVIYSSPEEDENGIPDFVMVFYERQPRDVILSYPEWSNPKNRRETDKEKIGWFEFWDSETRYCEADGEPVLGGVKPNIYGFTPFVRKYSGFGRRSPDGELSNLIVSDIKRSRDLLQLECVVNSNNASVSTLFAQRERTFWSPDDIDERKFHEGYKIGEYYVNLISPVNQLNRLDDTKYEQISDAAVMYHERIKAELNQRHPFIMAGFPLGTSGRQDDIAQMLAMRRYDSIVDGTESMWATAFEKAWELCQKLDLIPEGLSKGDMDAEIKCVVKLRAKDPIEEDRKVTMGSRLLAAKEIDPITNLIEFKGYTEDKAMQIMVDMLKWEVLLNSPEIRQLIGMKAVEKAGMSEYLNLLQEQTKQQGLVSQSPPTTQQRIQGEVQTPMGYEESVPRGARQPPIAYTRGG